MAEPVSWSWSDTIALRKYDASKADQYARDSAEKFSVVIGADKLICRVDVALFIAVGCWHLS